MTEKLAFYGANAQETFLFAAWRRYCKQGTAIEEAVGHLKKVNSSLGQYPFALGFIPAKFHGISYPQLYPQSNPVIKGGGGLTASAAWNLDFWGLYRLSRLSRRAVERAVERQTEAARAELLASQWAQRQRGSHWCRMWPRPTSNCAALNPQI